MQKRIFTNFSNNQVVKQNKKQSDRLIIHENTLQSLNFLLCTFEKSQSIIKGGIPTKLTSVEFKFILFLKNYRFMGVIPPKWLKSFAQY